LSMINYNMFTLTFFISKDQGLFDLSLYDPFKIDAIKKKKKQCLMGCAPT